MPISVSLPFGSHANPRGGQSSVHAPGRTSINTEEKQSAAYALATHAWPVPSLLLTMR